jgi:hypothetical protein
MNVYSSLLGNSQRSNRLAKWLSCDWLSMGSVPQPLLCNVASGLHSRSVSEDSCSSRVIVLFSYIALSLICTEIFLHNGVLHCELWPDLSVYDYIVFCLPDKVLYRFVQAGWFVPRVGPEENVKENFVFCRKLSTLELRKHSV